jgi:hypothetical protein
MLLKLDPEGCRIEMQLCAFEDVDPLQAAQAFVDPSLQGILGYNDDIHAQAVHERLAEIRDGVPSEDVRLPAEQASYLMRVIEWSLKQPQSPTKPSDEQLVRLRVMNMHAIDFYQSLYRA